MRVLKLGATLGILLGITSSIGALTHGNDWTGSAVFALGWLNILITANAFEN